MRRFKKTKFRLCEMATNVGHKSLTKLQSEASCPRNFLYVNIYVYNKHVDVTKCQIFAVPYFKISEVLKQARNVLILVAWLSRCHLVILLNISNLYAVLDKRQKLSLHSFPNYFRSPGATSIRVTWNKLKAQPRSTGFYIFDINELITDF